ncbi:MAG TPA: BatA domain-containing protein, partial [Gemmatimonadales bacterium]|nr:BatA domain-containing protein [Gemmatimonadales bacterium]
MGFASPMGLAALLALAIPLLLHLARRTPKKPVLVGSLRHLEGAAPVRRARSRLSELPLLAVRLLLLAALALVLAEPWIDFPPQPGTPRSLVVVSPELTETEGPHRALIDSLSAEGADVELTPDGDTWSILAERVARLPAGSSITAVFPASVRVAGSRPALASSVSIRLVPRVDGPVAAGGRERGTHRVLVHADSATSGAGARVTAAFRAVAEMRGDSVVVAGLGSTSPLAGDWIVWLGDSAPGDSVVTAIHRGATLLAAPGGWSRLPPSAPLDVARAGAGRIITLRALADPPLDASFPDSIARIWP